MSGGDREPCSPSRETKRFQPSELCHRICPAERHQIPLIAIMTGRRRFATQTGDDISGTMIILLDSYGGNAGKRLAALTGKRGNIANCKRLRVVA